MAKPVQYNNRLGMKGWWGGRYGLERWAYFLHRLTGLVIVLYLIIHIFVTSARVFGPEAWEATMGAVGGPVFRFLEYLLIAAITYHGFNGLRLIFIEWFGWSLGRPRRPIYPYVTSLHHQRPLLIGMMILAFLFLVFSAWGFLTP